MPKVDESHMAARRAQILDAARACFVEKGLHPTSVPDICRRAGMSVGGLYRHFASKQEIVDALFAQSDASNDSALSELVAERCTLAETVSEFLGRFVAEGAAEALQMSVVMQAESLRDESVRAAMTDQLHEVRASFPEGAVAAQRTGAVDSALDAEAVAVILVAVLEGLKTQLVFDDSTLSASVRSALPVLLQGLVDTPS